MILPEFVAWKRGFLAYCFNALCLDQEGGGICFKLMGLTNNKEAGWILCLFVFGHVNTGLRLMADIQRQVQCLIC